MDHDDDVEHLFSWLQTPELRYREFAGAREITDTVVIVHQQRANNTPVPEDEPEVPPGHDTQLSEEYPEDQFPDQGETRIEVEQVPVVARVAVREEVVVAQPVIEPPRETRSAGRGPMMIAPEPVAPAPEPPPPPAAAEPNQPAGNAGLFALGAQGRSPSRTGPAEWVGPRPPLNQTPAARQPDPPAPLPPAPPAPAAPPPQPAVAAAASSRLLGGAYRENGTNGNAAPAAPAEPPATQQRDARSLDAVFGRLAGGRNRLPDPRERLRHIPGLGPPSGRR